MGKCGGDDRRGCVGGMCGGDEPCRGVAATVTENWDVVLDGGSRTMERGRTIFAVEVE